MLTKKTITLFICLTVFSVAMGYLESAVVVYLRKIYYPEGFTFPLIAIDQHTAMIEIFREVATLIMLVGAGFLAARTPTERFGFFLFCFGIWDIFYYIFLKLLIGWPESMLTWDILFLIPVTWVGPVIGPVINSMTMITLSIVISHFTDKNKLIRIKMKEWTLLVLGSLIVIFSYILDYLNYILEDFKRSDFIDPSKQPDLLEKANGYIPLSFPWWIFAIGEILLITAICIFFFRNKKIITNSPK
jgi:hypothetical protein